MQRVRRFVQNRQAKRREHQERQRTKRENSRQRSSSFSQRQLQQNQSSASLRSSQRNSLRSSQRSARVADEETERRSLAQRQFVEAALEGDVDSVKDLLNNFSNVIDVNGLHDGRPQQVRVSSSFRKKEEHHPRVPPEQRLWKVWYKITALQAACKAGHLDVVMFLVQQSQSMDLNVWYSLLGDHNECHGPPLCQAARYGHDHIVRYMFLVSLQQQKKPYHSRDTKKVVDVNQSTPQWGSALYQACRHGHLEVLRAFVDYDESVAMQHSQADNRNPPIRLDWNICNPAEDGKTALHVAMEHDHLELVHLLLDQSGLDVNTPDHHGSTPLQYAIAMHQLELVGRLLAHPKINVNHANHYGNTPLHTVVRMNKPAPRVLDRIDDDAYGSATASTSTSTLTVLQALVHHPTMQTFQRNREGQTPLHLAVVLQRPLNVLECLLETRDDEGQEETRTSAEATNSEITDAALPILHMVNFKDNQGFTALHHAWKTKHLAAIQCLVHHPAIDLNVRFHRDWTQLHLLTAHLQHINPASLMVVGSSDATHAMPQEQDETVNPLHEDHVEGESSRPPPLSPEELDWINLFYFLQQQPSFEINAQDGDGDTALHMACLCGSYWVQEALVNNPRIDGSIRNAQGQTAWDLIATNNAVRDDFRTIALAVQISNALDPVLHDLALDLENHEPGSDVDSVADEDDEKAQWLESRSLKGDALGVVYLWLEDVRQSRRLALRKSAEQQQSQLLAHT